MNEKKIKVDIVCPPYSGHLNPILELINPFIEDENYDICIHTGENKRLFIENLGIKCKVICPDKPNIFEKIVNTSKKTNIFISLLQFKENIKLIPEIIEYLEIEFKKRETDIVIADFIAIPAGIVSNKMGIPWISTMPTPFVIESKSTTPSYMGGWYPKDNKIYKIRDALGRKVIRLFKKIVVKMAKVYLKDFKYELYNEKNEENAYSPYSILALGMKELEFRDDFPERLIWTGACVSKFSEKRNGDVEKLDFDKKILVTIGTHLIWGKGELIKLVEELSKIYKNVAFIISLGNFSGKDKPMEKIGDNIFLYEYIDYGEILPVVDYVIHHGGAGILYSCIKYNKPAVIIPHDYDQFDFATRADIAKIGIPSNVKNIKTIINSLDKMFKKEKWKELKIISEKYRDYNPSEILRKEIERLLRLRKK